MVILVFDTVDVNLLNTIILKTDEFDYYSMYKYGYCWIS